MASDLRIQGEVVVNSEQAESAFNRVGDKAQQMATEVATSAGKAGQSVDKIGDGAGASAEKFTRAESRISASIKRATNELELLGKTASQRLEFNIADKGLDPKKFEPALQKLREVEAQAQAAQRAASGSLDKMGISAAQTAAALRGVPAQFTDIITSLQGGQAPLTVFLQQGGQLKDMFGGAGAAARALGGYVVGLINPFTLAAAGAAALAVAYNQGSKEADAYRTALVTTGNAAGTTSGQLKSYAQEISGLVGTQGKAAESLAAFVSTGRVSRDVLKEASQAAIAWERATGQAVGATAKQFADLGKDPLQAVLKLNEGTNFLTESVYRQIKSLEEQGKTADAAAKAQRAYADALTGRAGEIERNLGSIETAWNKVKDAAKGGWDAILNVGRAETNQDKLTATRKQIADLENRLASGGGFGSTAGGAATGRPDAANNARLRAQLLGLQAQAAALEGVAFAAKIAAEDEAERAKQMQAAAAWDREGAKYLTDKAKLERDLTAARNEGLAAGKSKAEIEQRLAQIRESYAKKGIAAENKDLRDQQRIFAELADVSSTYYADLEKAQQQRAKGNLSEAQYVKYVETLIQKQPFAVTQEKERAEAIKESAKAAAESSKHLSAWYDAREKESQGFANQINARREEVALMGMTTEAVVAYTQAKYEQQAAEKEAYAAALESASFYAGEYAEAYKTAAEAARNQAKQLRELGGLEVEKVNREAAKKAKDEWERAAEQINRSLTDALLRGFESGKDFAKNLRDTIKNMFSTLVLRPIISAVMTPVSGMVNGLVQGGMNAVGLGGGGNLMGMASNASSMYSAASSFNTGWFTNFGATAPASLYSSGAQLYSQGFETIGSGMMDLGNSMAQYSQAINTAGSWLGYGKAMYDLTQGNYGSSVGTAIGTYFGGPIGSAIGSFVGGLVDKWTGSRGANHSGGVYSTATPDRMAAAAGLGLSGGALGDFTQRGNTAIDAQLGAAVGALSSVYQGLAKYAGDSAKQIDIVAGFAVNGKYKDEDAYGYFKLLDKLTGEELASYAKRDGGLGNDPEKAWAQYITDMGSALVGEIRKADIPKWMDNIFAGLGDKITTEGLSSALQQIAKIDSAFALLGNNIEYLADISGATQTALLELSGGIDALMANASAYYENFYSADERRAAVQRQLQTAFDGLDLKLPDIDASDARAQFRALAEAQDLSTDAGRKTYAALLQLSGAFAGVTQSAEDAAAAAKQLAEEQERALQDAIRSARDLLRRAIDRDRDALQDQASGMQDVINALSASVSTLKINARELYGQVDGTAQMLAAQGMVYIEQALGGVRAGASITDYTGLTDAISAARGGINTGAYASQFERERDALVLAGQLSELGELGDLQLSIEERQLKALTAQIDALDALAQRADDLINGTTALTGTVQSYFDQLLKLLNPEKPEEAEKKTGGVFAIGGSATGGGGGGDSGTPYDKDAAVRYTVGAQLKYGADKGLSHDDPAVLKAINAAVYGTGITQADIAKAYGVPEDDIARLFAGVGLPKFDVGTNRVPRTGLAVVHEGEAIIPKAYNPWTGGGQAGGNAEMVAELRALREEVAQLRAVSQATASSTAQMADQLDQVTEGGNAMRTEVIA